MKVYVVILVFTQDNNHKPNETTKNIWGIYKSSAGAQAALSKLRNDITNSIKYDDGESTGDEPYVEESKQSNTITICNNQDSEWEISIEKWDVL